MTEEINTLLDERATTNRRGRPLALLFSFAVHFGTVAWLLFPVLGNATTTQAISAPGFVHVRMIDEPAGEEAAETATVVEVEPAPPEPVREEAPRLVEKVPEKKAPPPKPKKTKPKTSPPPRPAPVKSSGATSSGKIGMGGGASQGGLVGLDGLDTRFSWYLDLVVSRISASWQEPHLDARFGKTYKVTVYFIIQRNGSLSDVRVEETSGIDLLDLSAVRSIRDAAPLPPLPQDFRGDQLGVHFWFEYKRD